MKRKTQNPFAQVVERRYQFSLQTMLILIAVFSVIFTVIMLGLRTPELSNEVNAYFGVGTPKAASRLTSLTFSLVCYTAPLMLALIVQLFFRINRAIIKQRIRRGAIQNDASKDPFAD